MIAQIPVFFGRRVIRFFEELGKVTQFFLRTMTVMLTQPIHWRQTLEQMKLLGTNSFWITVVTAIFVGMAFTLQVVREFLKFGAGKMIGGVVGIAFWRELGPLMTGVVVAGRVGAAIAAELGTMKVTEQVEALESMSQDPIRFLVVPRIIAVTLMMPLLVGMADVVGFFGGYIIAVNVGRINPYLYFDSANTMLRVADVSGGLLKAAFFGFLIALISSYMGLHARSGAKGVGDMTTRAVVTSLIVIFVVNYFLSSSLF
ncbi:ABC transporter permease [bacterium]|nr:ABC transporter permease [bacterium]